MSHRPSVEPVVKRDTEGPVALAEGQVIASHRLVRLAGRGGMAEVWQALDLHLQRHHAIKILRPEVSRHESAVERFLREARAIARLNHPNIIQVHQVAQENGLVFLVMEWVEGESLEHLLRREQKLPFDRAFRIIEQVASGLSYAHSRNIIHRDIKPGNMLVLADGSVKLVDFGLAKIFEEEARGSSVGSSMGTPYYMSPETVFGKPMDHRSDIYSLGITFYRLLVGDVPFNAPRVVDVAAKQVHEPLPEPAELKNLANGKVLDVIRKMASKAPADRFAGYGDLLNALNDISPTSYTQTSNSEVLAAGSQAKLARQRNRAVLVSLLAVLAVVLLVAYILVPRHRKTDVPAAASLPSEKADPQTAASGTTPGEVSADIPEDVAMVANVYGASGKKDGATSPKKVAEPAGTPLPSLPAEGKETPVPLSAVLKPPAPVATAGEIIIDDANAEYVVLSPRTGWQPSSNIADSYQGGSRLAPVDNRPKEATFHADIPNAGSYFLELFWVPSTQDFRSDKVQVTVHGANGDTTEIINQVTPKNRTKFVSIGKYEFSAGKKVRIATVSTAGITNLGVYVSVDAMRLMPAE